MHDLGQLCACDDTDSFTKEKKKKKITAESCLGLRSPLCCPPSIMIIERVRANGE